MIDAIYYPMYCWDNHGKKNYFILLTNPCYDTVKEACEKAVGDGFEIMATSTNVSAMIRRAFRFPVLGNADEVSAESGVRLVNGEINHYPVMFCAGHIWESEG